MIIIGSLRPVKAERAVLVWRYPFVFPEFSDKVTEVIESDGKRNLRNRQLRLGKELAGLLNPVFIDERNRRFSDFLFEIMAEIVGAHKAYSG